MNVSQIGPIDLTTFILWDNLILLRAIEVQELTLFGHDWDLYPKYIVSDSETNRMYFVDVTTSKEIAEKLISYLYKNVFFILYTCLFVVGFLFCPLIDFNIIKPIVELVPTRQF